jgi:hypothetical protein
MARLRRREKRRFNQAAIGEGVERPVKRVCKGGRPSRTVRGIPVNKDGAMDDGSDGSSSQPGASPEKAAAALALTDGCYLINYTSAVSPATVGYAGTLRVESKTGQTRASGDFYRRSFDLDAGAMAPIPDPKTGVPTFPIADYRYYLGVTAIDPTAIGFDFTIALTRYSKDPVTCFLDDSQTNWLAEETLTARMQIGAPPPNDPQAPPVDFRRPTLSPCRTACSSARSQAARA